MLQNSLTPQASQSLAVERLKRLAVAKTEAAPQAEIGIPWRPLEGRQTDGYNSPADILFYGGAAGGGKTDLLLGLALTAHQKSIIFRRQFPQLREIIERSKAIIEEAGRFNENAHVWRDLPNGRMLELGACNTEDDKNKWKGRAHDLKGFDEVTEFTESQFRFLMGWTRTATPGQRTRVVCTGNPPTSPIGEWVVRFWAPWLDEQHPHPAMPGELRWFAMVDGKDVERENGEPFAHKDETIQPLSRSFISARLADNPYLMATGYESTLQNLPEPLRSMLLFGRFGVGVEDDPWQVIPTQWVIMAEQRWTDEAPEALSALGCDVARGGDDKTVFALRHGNWYAPLKKHAGSSTPDGAAVANLVMLDLGEATAFVDVIGVGSSVYDTLHTRGVNVTGVNFAEHSSATDRAHKLKFRNKRAEYYWRMREMLDPTNGENIALPPDRELRADLCSPHWSITTGGIQIESKEDIKGRLGRSTDCGDAVVMALSGVSISMASAKPAPAESRWRPVAQEGSRWVTGGEGKSRWRG